jgi:hypothetical protein
VTIQTIEERLKLLIGEQVFQLLASQIEVEKLRAQVAAFEQQKEAKQLEIDELRAQVTAFGQQKEAKPALHAVGKIEQK